MQNKNVLKKNKNYFVINKKRKSRIIMKDGEKILEQAKAIWQEHPLAKVDVLVEGPVCSKTKEFLHSHKIEIIQEEYAS